MIHTTDDIDASRMPYLRHTPWLAMCNMSESEVEVSTRWHSCDLSCDLSCDHVFVLTMHVQGSLSLRLLTSKTGKTGKRQPDKGGKGFSAVTLGQ
jgi:hypothetical protein